MSKCPLCGADGYAGFTRFECGNAQCKNYKAPEAPPFLPEEPLSVGVDGAWTVQIPPDESAGSSEDPGIDWIILRPSTRKTAAELTELTELMTDPRRKTYRGRPAGLTGPKWESSGPAALNKGHKNPKKGDRSQRYM